VDAARAALTQAEWKLSRKFVNATVPGLVYDVPFRPGEWVPAGSTVVRMLPAANVKVRFYVPETVVGALKNGQAVHIRCDGCGHTYLERSRVHATGHLQQRDTPQARVPDRGTSGPRRSTEAAPWPACRGHAIMNGELAIDVHGLNKRFGDKHVVNDLTMQVARGEIFGFLARTAAARPPRSA
jgi:hypothetical protein